MDETPEIVHLSSGNASKVLLSDICTSVQEYAHGAFNTCLIYKQVEMLRLNPILNAMFNLEQLAATLLGKALIAIENEAYKAKTPYKLMQLELLLDMLPCSHDTQRQARFGIEQKKTDPKLWGNLRPPSTEKPHVKKADSKVTFHFPYPTVSSLSFFWE